MAHTRSDTLKTSSPRSPDRILLRAFLWARRCPQAALWLNCLLLGAVVGVDLRSQMDAGAELAYLLVVALTGVVLPSPWSSGLAAGAVIARLVVQAVALGPDLLHTAVLLGNLTFVVSLLFLVYLAHAFRRSLVRELQQTRVLDGKTAVSAAVNSSLDLRQVLQTTVRQARRVAGAEVVGIWLLDPECAELSLAASEAHNESYRVRADSARVELESEHILALSVARRAALLADARPTGAAGREDRLFSRRVRGVAVVPLLAHGAPVGVMAAGLTTAQEAYAIQVLQELANDAAIAIENARLYAEARRHVSDLERMQAQAERNARRAGFLAEAGSLFSASLDVRTTMESVVAKATEVLGDACLIGMVDPETAQLRITASYENHAAIGRSLRDYLATHPVRVGWGIFGRPAADGQPRLARGDPDHPGELGEYARNVGLRAAIAVPLLNRGRVVGVLASAYYSMDQPPAHGDLQVAVLLADRAAVAIENAALFEETQRARLALEAWSHELEQRVEQKTRELQAAQRELLRAERLASIGQLAATVAHELRNPLNVIKVAHYALRHGASAERQQRHLDAIARQVDASSRIIEALLDFARDAPPDLSPVDVNSLVDQVLADGTIPDHVQVARETGPDLPLVSADRLQIGQVLTNLIENAVQAMPSGGLLTLGTFLQRGTVCLSVSDTGGGIPPEVRARIFEPLFTTKTKGTGLGLAIARRIIEAHDGEIRVESTPGVGSTFTLALPVCAEAADQ